MPGMPMLLMRPVHARPDEHVPLPPEPQHGCPAPPQVPHWLPVAETMQLNVDWQADVVVPPSPPPPVVEQQGWPEPPQVEQVPGIPPVTLRPPQPRPAVVHEPFPWPPQQAWPAPPQVPHLRVFPAATMQLRPVEQAEPLKESQHG